MKHCWLLLLLLVAGPALGQAELPALIVEPQEDGGSKYSVSLQLLFLMTTLTMLPTALIMLTPFTRIIIILAILRQGIGMAQTPNNQILIGLALFVTFFIMTPVLSQVNSQALTPYMNEELSFTEALSRGRDPVRTFMANQTRESDLALFTEISGATVEDPSAIPMSVLIPAFITSEMKTAFQIGFLLLLPFLVIDLVVASILMSMGMVMLSPLVISLPFKLMLFVMVDGWGLVVGTVASSFFI
ncbi:MAG: flagellar type III secretion system pore protein FliP [Xanthomonadales bacterium]|nr:flagellar type III secretion system pore protein FliP [Xanthomonadales bacterium]